MTSEWTGRQRVTATFKGNYPDTVAISIPIAPYGAKLIGCGITEFYNSPAKRVQALIAGVETFKPDVMGVGSDPYATAESIGSEVQDTIEVGLAVKSHVLADKAALARMEIPDLRKGPRFSVYLEVCERLLSELKDVAVGSTILGPWSAAMMMRGAEELIYDTVDDPEFVHELMRFATELTKIYGMEVRSTGVGVTMADPSAGCSLISPKIFREFVKPYHVELVDYFKKHGLWVSTHICGYVDPIMEDILETGVGSISIDGPSSLEKLVGLAQQKAAIIGNVPTELFVEGTKDQLEEAVRRCIDTALGHSRYVLCSGCAVPFEAPVENVHHFMEAGRRYGREVISRLKEGAA